ncbi:putative undecaprenyl-diphosphatase YbjG [Andreesenia angusta]|uniref:Putative undecaprenyl-diphosphatase YbjG n=1 Tax=Andreesenia angusta TaxID=39480 RepID=A0A1S1V8I1_9FIRM|nr:phosphatase PAP2 family protein [Andreesenia angusta]OHW62457.1 putative undecaprenyl-diphosphatase YbjG [Andreesenia angusta]
MKIRERVKYREIGMLLIVLFIALGLVTGRTGYLDSFDKSILGYVQSGDSKVAFTIARSLGIAGSAAGYVLIGVYLLFKAADRKNYLDFKLYATSALLNTAFNQAFKLFYERVRPLDFSRIEVSGYSFPSGHSMAAMGVGLTLAYIASKRNRRAKKKYYAASIVVALLVGWSRMYLGVHWPTDILAGYLGGAIVFLLSINMEFKKK